MKKIGEIRDACEALLELDVDLKIERVPIEESYGRVLAGEVVSRIPVPSLSLIHISEPTRPLSISYAVF